MVQEGDSRKWNGLLWLLLDYFSISRTFAKIRILTNCFGFSFILWAHSSFANADNDLQYSEFNQFPFLFESLKLWSKSKFVLVLTTLKWDSRNKRSVGRSHMCPTTFTCLVFTFTLFLSLSLSVGFVSHPPPTWQIFSPLLLEITQDHCYGWGPGSNHHLQNQTNALRCLFELHLIFFGDINYAVDFPFAQVSTLVVDSANSSFLG